MLHGIQVDSSANEEDEDNEILLGQSPNKRPFIPNFPSIGPYSITGSTISTSSSMGHLLSTTKTARRAPQKQMKLCGNAVDPNATEKMHIAVADFIHSNYLPFSLAEDPMFLKVINVAKSLGAYKPPT